ncbi:MAG: O-antigen polymerase [Leptolyngbyaceae cyanobacterium]
MRSSNKKTSIDNLLRWLSILAIILAIVFIFTNSLSLGNSSPIVVVSFIINSVINISLLALSLSKDGISLRVTFFFFNSIFFGLVPLAQYVLGRWLFLSSYQNLLYANILILYASIFFCCGYKLSKVRSKRYLRKLINRKKKQQHQTCSISNKGFVFLILLVSLFAGFVIYQSGLNSLFLRSGSGVTRAVGGWGPLGLISQYFGRPLPLVLLLFSFYKFRFGRQQYFFNLLLIGCSIFLTLLLNFPLGIARFYAFTVYLAITITLIRPNKKKSYLYLAILLFGLLGSSILDGFRHASSLIDVNINFEFSPNSFFVGHYDAYENFVHAIDYVDANGNTWGRQLLGAVLFWVPRSIWADKPISTGAYIADEHLRTFVTVHNTNLSSPYIEELYIDFNILAVIIGCFLMGWLFGYLDYLYQRMSNDSFSQVDFYVQPEPMYFILYPTLIGLSLLWLRGAAMSAFAYTSGMVAAYAFVRFILVQPHKRFR